ncbi:MAG: MBOAT family O-acyltransferase [Gammaproteobacteria bacterium]
MFYHPQLAILLLLVGASIYWSIPPTRPGVRMGWLVTFSVAAIGLAAPYAVLISLAMSLMVVGWSIVFERQGRAAAQRSGTIVRQHSVLLFWTALCSVLAIPVLLDIRNVSDPVIVLGVSYVLLKSVVALMDSYAARRRLGLRQVALMNCFLPIYSAGPIEGPAAFAPSAFENRLNAKGIANGLSRITIGIFKTYFIAETIISGFLDARFADVLSSPERYGPASLGAFVLVRFLHVYVNFSGYSDMAIGASLLFGLRVSENFRHPWCATNLQEFWRRWHMSLARFVQQYVYLRLTVILRRPYVALFIAFVLAGLWHKVALGYLLWGIGHGAGLVTYAFLRRRLGAKATYRRVSASLPYTFLSWLSTMSYVAFLSLLANEDLSTVGRLALAFIGMRADA